MIYLLDGLVVVLFVLAGRRTHDGSLLSLGAAHALWPFLAALVLAWLVARLLRLPTAGAAAGAVVWLVTLGAGMGLRLLSGQGTATPFILVATLVLAAGFLASRLVVLLVERRRRA